MFFESNIRENGRSRHAKSWETFPAQKGVHVQLREKVYLEEALNDYLTHVMHAKGVFAETRV